jgi:hypothetical protein
MRGLALAILLGSWCSVAHAGQSVRTVPYAMDRVWPAALRLLRVDLKLKITERDREAGYVLFDMTDDKRTFKGSLELAPAVDDKGREGTRVQLKIDGRPIYVADQLLEKFQTKLHDELGEPPPPPPRPRKDPPKKDAPPAEGKPPESTQPAD